MAEKSIKCPHCSTTISLEEEYLGMEVQCPVCNQNFVVEADGGSNAPAENAVETTADGENEGAFAKNAKDKLENLFSNAKGKLGNLYANAKEKLTDDNAQALAANAKDKLENLFSNAKGKLGNLYANAKEKMDEAPSVKESTDPVNAGEPGSVARKEYDEDYLPEPDPGFYEKTFERSAIADKLTSSMFQEKTVKIAAVLIAVAVIWGSVKTATYNGRIYSEIKEEANRVVAETETIEAEAKRIIGEAKDDANKKEEFGKIQDRNNKIKKSAQQVINESTRFFSDDRKIKVTAELISEEADKMYDETWNNRIIHKASDNIGSASFDIKMKTRGIKESSIIGTLGIGIGILIIVAVLFVLIKIALRRKQIRCWKRDMVREYFDAGGMFEQGTRLLDTLIGIVYFIPGVNLIALIIHGLAQAKKRAYCKVREPIYDEVRDLDMEYLEKLNVLPRFGKTKQLLVSPMQTLFSPAFDGVDNLRPFLYVVSENDKFYRYNLEKVTKIYTFEDQLFIYTGVWAYAIGKMISERTDAFFFEDITNMRTESMFRIHKKYEPKGCLSFFIPGFGRKIETVYKESESFALTAASGDSIGLNIGFEDAIRVTGATYTRRNDNEKIVHAIRKMIEEKKVAADA